MKEYIKQIEKLKRESGTHSPSIETLKNELPDLILEVDACFLSNPYATELFMGYFERELIAKRKIIEILEFYPPQVAQTRKHITEATGINEKNIFVGNGAIEIIQALLHRFVKGKLCVILPTFSSYYEFVNEETEVVYYYLKKENDFELDVDDYLKFILENEINNIVLINPNNPNGGYLDTKNVGNILARLNHLDNIIVDESFIHFAFEDSKMIQVSSEDMVNQYRNLCIIKSMSKDFGIAGIRAGYGVMSRDKVESLLSNGYLWNVSGLANYFFQVYGRNKFQKEYDVVRKKYIMNTVMFLTELQKIDGLKIYPSKANFALVEILTGATSFDFTMKLLLEHGVYVRDCEDKIGLNGEFVRIASRSFEENLKIIDAIRIVVS